MDNMEPMQPVQPTEPTPPAQPASPKKSKKTKKIIAIVLAVVIFLVAVFGIAFAISSDKDKSKVPTCDCEYCSQMFAYYNYLIETGQIELKEVQGVTPDVNDFMQNNQQQDNQQDVPQNNNQQDNTQQSADPTKWTTAEVVETYRHAAGRTHNSVTSYQDMKLRDDSLNAPGIPSALLSFAEGIMAKALSNNSMNIKGITGGHQNLTVSDVQGARAYKSGNNIVIEMVMKEQTDKGNGQMYSGTVGHAISVVGDIDSVVGQFSALGMTAQIADEDCTLQYKNPRLKVTLDSNGRIINGTWSYYVNITLNNMTISGLGMTVPVKQATAVVDFVVTLNGGFKG
ncbi:MAG: hypothetical protein IKC45_08500 [Clostridia bacterium]|nr:hypothetical protein [Clostridia bacterium]